MGRQGGGRAPPTREVQVSKKLSWLLRHGAEAEGLKLQEGGYIAIQDVLSNRNFKSLKITFPEIKQIVSENDKQRFALIHVSQLQRSTQTTDQTQTAAVDAPTEDSNDPKQWLIRANQGHSIKVDDAGLITPITIEAGNLPVMVVHGTQRAHWTKIVASGGLKKMGRNHVHFATGLPQSLRGPGAKQDEEQSVTTIPDTKPAPTVLSGMRNSSTVLIYLDLPKALEAGVRFGLSDNGVVLSEGDADGLVRLNLFSIVEERGGNILVKDGVVVGELSNARSST